MRTNSNSQNCPVAHNQRSTLPQRRRRSRAKTLRNDIFPACARQRSFLGQTCTDIKGLSSAAADIAPRVSLSPLSDVSYTDTVNFSRTSAPRDEQFCVLGQAEVGQRTARCGHSCTGVRSGDTTDGDNKRFVLFSRRCSALPVLLLLLTTVLTKTEARAPVSSRRGSSVPVLDSIPSYSSEAEADYPPELRPRVPDEPLHESRIFFQQGQHSEEDLPVCSGHSVCNKISTYSTPYAERLCRCPGAAKCSTSLDTNDGYTVVDKNLQFKTCEPAKKLPQCKLFGEVAYTMIFYPDNVTQTVLHCTCPKNAVTYVVHKDPYRSNKGYGYFYSFACSPLQLVCKRKEPCRLFSARKRTDFEEVTTTVLCRCPTSRSCPVQHTDHGVVPGKLYSDESVRTYSGYCV